MDGEGAMGLRASARWAAVSWMLLVVHGQQLGCMCCFMVRLCCSLPSCARSAALPTQVISVEMDASSVPQKYLFTIYTQCFTFPEKLIFFLTGNLQVRPACKAAAGA